MLTIDLKALAANYRIFQKKTGPDCIVAGIVKAGAYGLGMKEVIGALSSLHCPLYFVATPEEGYEARTYTDKDVAVFNGVQTIKAAKELVSRNIMPVLNSLHDIRVWREALEQCAPDRVPPAMLHFDTGMNRLGIGEEEAVALFDDPHLLKGLKIDTVLSHLSCADEKDNSVSKQQYQRFCKIAKKFPQTRQSLANSSGLFRDPAYHFDMVRPGMALYGLNPLPEQDSPVQPVVALHCPILQVRTARKGETAGYGQSHVLSHDTKLATVALGYADGFLRSLSNRGTLYYQDRACPVIGRVSMDVTVIDLGPESLARPGETVEVIGSHQSADDLAADAGTIGYEILTALGSRYPRSYVPV